MKKLGTSPRTLQDGAGPPECLVQLGPRYVWYNWVPEMFGTTGIPICLVQLGPRYVWYDWTPDMFGTTGPPECLVQLAPQNSAIDPSRIEDLHWRFRST